MTAGLCLVLPCLVGTAAPDPQPSYSVTTLPGVPAVEFTFAPRRPVAGINGRGEVAMTLHPWSAVVIVGGDKQVLDPHVSTVANDIAEDGTVVGSAGRVTSGAISARESQAVVWRAGGREEVATIREFGGDDEVCSINARGWLVGTCRSSTFHPDGPEMDATHAYLCKGVGAAAIDLGPAIWSVVNDRGQVAIARARDSIASTTPKAPDEGHLLVWERGRFRDLGPGAPRAMNNAGEIVGSGPDGPSLWQPDGRRTTLKGPPGYLAFSVCDINEAGATVGSGGLEGSRAGGRALLWSGGSVLDLNNAIPRGSGWVLHEAQALNRRGQIVSLGEYKGETRAFLLTPRPVRRKAVPR